jgi:hypothetical protein
MFLKQIEESYTLMIRIYQINFLKFNEMNA